MTSTQLRHETKKTNQENVHSHLAVKGDIVAKVNVVRRGALGELGNKLQELQPAAKDEKATFTKPKENASVHLGALKKIDHLTSKENRIPKPVKAELLLRKFETVTREESILNAAKVAEAKKHVQLDRLKPNQVKTKVDPTLSKVNEEPKKNVVVESKDEDPASHGTDYSLDIMKYMQEQELEFPVKKAFLTGTKVTPSMRSKLVNWLVDVHMSFSMEQDTLYLAVSLADRYLQASREVDRTNYQLVGTSALMLAGKYVDVYPPTIEDYLYVCNDAFNKKQLMQMEVTLLKSLDFRLGFSISIFFLRRFSKMAEVTAEEYQLSKYILELALLEYSVAHVRPSIQAAAAVCLAQGVFRDSMTPGTQFWTDDFQRVTAYTYADFRHVLHEFACILNRAKSAKQNVVVREKYASSKLMKVSTNLRLQGRLIKKYVATQVKHEMI